MKKLKWFKLGEFIHRDGTYLEEKKKVVTKKGRGSDAMGNYDYDEEWHTEYLYEVPIDFQDLNIDKSPQTPQEEIRQ